MSIDYRPLCPVCRQNVWLSNVGNSLAHADKIGMPCPMSGQLMGVRS